MTFTHTYATLAVSEECFGQIARKLKAAGYHKNLEQDGLINMQGIALKKSDPYEPCNIDISRDDIYVQVKEDVQVIPDEDTETFLKVLRTLILWYKDEEGQSEKEFVATAQDLQEFCLDHIKLQIAMEKHHHDNPGASEPSFE